jgi:hypothetical protein
MRVLVNSLLQLSRFPGLVMLWKRKVLAPVSPEKFPPCGERFRLRVLRVTDCLASLIEAWFCGWQQGALANLRHIPSQSQSLRLHAQISECRAIVCSVRSWVNQLAVAVKFGFERRTGSQRSSERMV